MKRFFKFLFRPLFLINLILALGSAVLIFYFIMSYIHDYTNHDDKYHTPNFIGVHVDDIDEFIKAKEIKYIKTLYSLLMKEYIININETLYLKKEINKYKDLDKLELL